MVPRSPGEKDADDWACKTVTRLLGYCVKGDFGSPRPRTPACSRQLLQFCFSVRWAQPIEIATKTYDINSSITAEGAPARTAGARASASITARGAAVRTAGARASASITADRAPARTAGAPPSAPIAARGAPVRTASVAGLSLPLPTRGLDLKTGTCRKARCHSHSERFLGLSGRGQIPPRLAARKIFIRFSTHPWFPRPRAAKKFGPFFHDVDRVVRGQRCFGRTIVCVDAGRCYNRACHRHRFGLWRVRFPPVLVRTGRRLPVQDRSVSLCAAYRYVSTSRGKTMRVIKDSFLLQGLLTRQKSHGIMEHDQKFTPFWNPLGQQIGLGIILRCSFQFTTSGAQFTTSGAHEHDQKWTTGVPTWSSKLFLSSKESTFKVLLVAVQLFLSSRSPLLVVLGSL